MKDAPGAVAFTLMIAVAALLGIKILIIENVANLDENDVFKTGLFDRLKSHGYSCIPKTQSPHKSSQIKSGSS